jgi:hypothetical protein
MGTTTQIPFGNDTQKSEAKIKRRFAFGFDQGNDNENANVATTAIYVTLIGSSGPEGAPRRGTRSWKIASARM